MPDDDHALFLAALRAADDEAAVELLRARDAAVVRAVGHDLERIATALSCTARDGEAGTVDRLLARALRRVAVAYGVDDDKPPDTLRSQRSPT